MDIDRNVNIRLISNVKTDFKKFNGFHGYILKVFVSSSTFVQFFYAKFGNCCFMCLIVDISGKIVYYK